MNFTMARTLVLLALVSALSVGCTTTMGTTDTGSPADDANTHDGGHDARALGDTGTSTDAGHDAGHDAGATDTGPQPDANADAGPDANVDDGGTDAAVDAGTTITCGGGPHTFVVTSDGSSYTIDGVAGTPGATGSPTIHMCADVTYTFDLTAVSSFHPMGLFAGTTNVMNLNPGTSTGYTVPPSGPFPDGYRCTIHGFGGLISVP